MLEPGVRARGDVLDVQSKKGQKITGTIQLPEGVVVPRWGLNVSATRDNGFSVAGTVDRKKLTFVIDGVPEGAYTVHGHLWMEGARYVDRQRVDAGAEVTLTLKKQ